MVVVDVNCWYDVGPHAGLQRFVARLVDQKGLRRLLILRFLDKRAGVPPYISFCCGLGRLFWFARLLLSAFASEMGHGKPQRGPKGVTVSPKSAQMVPKVRTGLFGLPF